MIDLYVEGQYCECGFAADYSRGVIKICPDCGAYPHQNRVLVFQKRKFKLFNPLTWFSHWTFDREDNQYLGRKYKYLSDFGENFAKSLHAIRGNKKSRWYYKGGAK